MKSGSLLERRLAAGQFVVTAEAGPPKGADPAPLRRKAEVLRGFVDACNVTDNQTAVVRMSSLAAGVLLLEAGLEPVLQMTTRDRNRIALQSDLLGASALGLRNVLCLSGDHQKFGNQPEAKNVYDLDSMQLLDAARGLRDRSEVMGGDKLDAAPRLFLGAAANPFADPFEIRAPQLAKKIAAGADFIQTQSIFNVEKFERFMQQVRDRGLHEQAAVLAGITPLKSARMAEYMAAKVPGMEVPEAVIARLRGVEKGKARDEGLALAAETIERVRAIPGVRGIHLMAVEWEEAVPELVKRAGLHPRPAAPPEA